VPVEEELERVIPVIKAIRKESSTVAISVDTFYSKVAQEAVANGANIINDITAGTFDSDMIPTCAKLRVPIVLMHSKGDASTMMSLAEYNNVVAEVKEYLQQRAQEALKHSVYRWNIVLDLGFGFAKKSQHSLELLRHGKEFVQLGYPLLYGTSRKGFIGELTHQPDPQQRAFGTAATCTVAIQQGAGIM
jgi:dihydropteroate synthase